MANGIENQDGAENAVPEKSAERGVIASLWYVFSSMKTAIVLLLLLAAASTVAATLESRYNLRGLYDSTPYVILLTLIGINLAVCSINRFGISWRRTFHPKVSSGEKQIKGMQRSQEFSASGSVEDTAEKVVTALRSSSYHVVKGQDNSGVVLYASRGRASIWGPYLTHLSLLVIFAGAILGNRLGFEGFTRIDEGDSIGIYMDSKINDVKELGFQVFLRKFDIEKDANGHITGYKSDLTIIDDGKEVASKVIDVNRPLTYKGVSFFQSSYGLSAFKVKVTAPNGESKELIYALSQQENGYAVDEMEPQLVNIGGKHLAVFAHDFLANQGGMGESMADVNDPTAQIMVNTKWPENRDLKAWKPLGWLTSGEPVEYNGWKVEMGDTVSYTGLQVGKNPGLPIIYIGFGLVLLGVIASFYIPLRVIRARISLSNGKSSVLVGSFSRAESSTFDKEFERIKEFMN